MAEKPRFRQRTVFAKNLGFGVGFGYRNNTKLYLFWYCMTHTLPFLTGSALCYRARRISRVYPVHIWQLRWVYASKINGRLVYSVYPRMPPIHHWVYCASYR